MKAALIYNPTSAGGKGEMLMKALRPRLVEYFPGLDIRATKTAGHGSELTRELLLQGNKLLLSMGGDGSNHDVLNGLVNGGGKVLHSDVSLGFIPTGTGNDFIRTLGVPNDALRALEMLREGKELSIDVGFVRNSSGQYRSFLNSISMGVSGLANLKLKAGGKKWGGKLSYLKGGLQALLEYKSVSIRIRQEEAELFSGPILNVVLANGRYFGGGMLVSPLSSLEDGILDLVVIGAKSRLKSILSFGRIYNGSHVSLPFVSLHKGQSFQLEAEGESPVMEVDGEVLDWKLPIEVKVLAKAIRVRGSRL